MKTITLKLDEETRDELDTEAERRGYSSRSEYLREIIDRRHEADEARAEYEDRVEELKTEVERAEARADELRRQLQATRGNVEEKVDTLVEKDRDRGSGGGVLLRLWRALFGR